MNYIVLLGRILFSWIFISALPSHFSEGAISFATSAGVPMASLLVPASGILACIGGLSVLIGYKARLGAWMLVMFLIPVTYTMHNWWDISEPAARSLQHIMFNKNLSMLGGAFLITHFGAGPFSIDWLIGLKNRKS